MANETGRRIQVLAAPIAAALGCEVVAVRFGQGKRRAQIAVFLDAAQPEPTEAELQAAASLFDPERDPPPAPYLGSRVSIETCVQASHEIGAVIDAENAVAGSYVLEVSSPGLERPLVRLGDFVRHRGRPVDVRTLEPLGGSRRFRGRLARVEREAFTVVPTEGPAAPVRILFENVDAARLVFDLPAPVRPGKPGSKAGKR